MSKDTPTPVEQARLYLETIFGPRTDHNPVVLEFLEASDQEQDMGFTKWAARKALALLPLDPGEAPAPAGDQTGTPSPQGLGEARTPTKEIMETMLLCIWEWRKDVRLAEEKERPVAQALFEGKIRGMEKAIKIVRAAAPSPAPAPKGAPWCEPCRSYHDQPETRTHWERLQCKAPAPKEEA